MLDSLWVVGLVPAPFIVYFFLQAVRYRRNYVNKDIDFKHSTPFVIFQVTTKDGPPVVADVIKRVREICALVDYHDYRIDVVINDPEKSFDANMIRVPREFQTPNKGRFKSRALHYAVLWRRERRENTQDNWIFHLDEESFVTKQGVLSVLKHTSAENPAPIAEGPIIYPNKMFEVSYLCRFSEALRPYICYDCVHQMTKKKVPIHMHGSNLLVRSDIEDRVGWDFEHITASEDQRFGHEAYVLLGPGIFGWHGGVIEEQPPPTLSWWIKQRRRWFVGNMNNIWYGKVPLRVKAEVVGRWASWGTGFLSGLASVVALVVVQNLSLELQIALTLVAAIWFGSYQIGMRHNLKPLSLPLRLRLSIHAQLFFLTPVLGLIECYAAFSAPTKLKAWTWEPTAK